MSSPGCGARRALLHRNSVRVCQRACYRNFLQRWLPACSAVLTLMWQGAFMHENSVVLTFDGAAELHDVTQSPDPSDSAAPGTGRTAMALPPVLTGTRRRRGMRPQGRSSRAAAAGTRGRTLAATRAARPTRTSWRSPPRSTTAAAAAARGAAPLRPSDRWRASTRAAPRAAGEPPERPCGRSPRWRMPQWTASRLSGWYGTRATSHNC